jgi:hypothetical protein
MALILKDASIVIDSVDLSDHANHVEITSDKELIDVTAFGATSKQNELGLGDGSMKFTFLQDLIAASVDDTLWAIHEAGDPVTIVVKGNSGAVSTSNPSYTMTGVLPSYQPLNADVGKASTVDATFQNTGQSGIVRATA